MSELRDGGLQKRLEGKSWIFGYRTLRQRTVWRWTVQLRNVRLRTVWRRTVRRNFPKRVDGRAESHDTQNTDNMDGAAELDTISVINEGK